MSYLLLNTLKFITRSFRKCSFFDGKMPFYAVARGRRPGIFNTWAECETQVKGFTGARFKKFDSPDEATRFITNEGQTLPQASRQNTSSNSSPRAKPPNPKFKKSYKPVASSSNDDVQFDNIDDIHDAIMRKMDQIENDVGEIKQKVFNKAPKKSIMIDAMPAATGTAGVKRPRESVPHLTEDSKRRKVDITQAGRSYKFDTDDSGYVVVYTDGACSSNGTKVAKAGLGVYFGEDHPLNISEPVSGRATNNCGEIQATTKAIKIAHSLGIKKLSINTDSQFVINSITKWVSGWKRKGWKLASGGPVKNEIDFKDLDQAVNLLDVKWVYVNAHKGILGNERADQLAKAGASQYNRR